MMRRLADTRTLPRRLRRFGRVPAPARGFIMGYILFALVMLGVVVAALSRIEDSQADAKWVDRALTRLQENLQNSRVQVITCAALITSGNPDVGGGQPQYPPQPVDNLLANVTCPQGSSPAIPLFDGSSGVFTPTPPAGFSPYTYVNTFPTAGPSGAAAVYIQSTTGSPIAVSALQRLQKSYSGQELDVTTNSSGVTTMKYYIAKRAAGSS